MVKVYDFPSKNDEILPIEEWAWSDFMSVWGEIAEKAGEEAAWKMVYQLWQARAGEDA